MNSHKCSITKILAHCDRDQKFNKVEICSSSSVLWLLPVPGRCVAFNVVHRAMQLFQYLQRSELPVFYFLLYWKHTNRVLSSQFRHHLVILTGLTRWSCFPCSTWIRGCDYYIHNMVLPLNFLSIMLSCTSSTPITLHGFRTRALVVLSAL